MKRTTIFVAAGLVCTVVTAHAQNATSDVGGTFQQVQTAATAWIPAIMAAATRLFYLLAAIDFAWSAPSFLRESDFMGLFLSLIKKLLVISFFYAVLVNGQTWIPAIVNSFITIGTNATGLSPAQSPSDIMAQGIQICSDLFDKVNGANLLTQTGAVLEDAGCVRGQKSRQCCEFLVRQDSSLEGRSFDLAGKFARTPLRFHRQPQIELTLLRAFVLPKNHEVVRPWQNSQQCCEFWLICVNIVELFHSP